MAIHFKISTAEFQDDAVVVTRSVSGGDTTILMVGRLGMSAHEASAMAAELLTLEERDELRRQYGVVAASVDPGAEVWDDRPLTNDAIKPEHWVDIGH